MARYIALIYSSETADPAEGSGDEKDMLAGYARFGQVAGERGALQGGERLRPSNEAKTVRVQGGKTVAVDGPFAETREQLGGFYLLDCKDEREAIELAAMIPAAQHGSVELRPIWEM